MAGTTLLSAERTVEQWRTEAGPDNPAGPLFTGGDFAEADIIMDGSRATHTLICGCSAGTASNTVSCC